MFKLIDLNKTVRRFSYGQARRRREELANTTEKLFEFIIGSTFAAAMIMGLLQIILGM